MASALEQSFIDICEKHDLTVFSVDRRTHAGAEPYWHSNCHWDGYSRRGFNCQSGNGQTIAEAVSNCLAAMRADREHHTELTLADEPLIAEVA